MKATGIVRRIDDLGRVVIPKEIRRTMRIREGEQSLIYSENNHIALDCGCVYGGALAAYCIESGKAVYIAKK